MTEVRDMTDLVEAFQLQNSVWLQFRFAMSETSKVPSLAVTAIAMDTKEDVPEAKCLASVSVICSAMNLRHWNGVLTHLMYALDFQLALNEFDGVNKKRA
jgi:hypothetical protein